MIPPELKPSNHTLTDSIPAYQLPDEYRGYLIDLNALASLSLLPEHLEDPGGLWMTMKRAAEVSGYSKSNITLLAQEGKITSYPIDLYGMRLVIVDLAQIMDYKRSVRRGRPPHKAQ